MVPNLNRKKAAKEFADRWKGKGYEKGESQLFWIDLLQNVFGIDDYYNVISFENRVKLNKTSFIDAYIVPTHVLIEQKSIKIDLRKPVPQSDGSTLTPYEQAERYNNKLKYSEKARWIVVCNFREFHIYDMERPKSAPEIIKLEDLPKEYHRLQFLVNDTVTNIKKEEQISLKAGEIVGVLYDKFAQKYEHLDDTEEQKSLNRLCVCLVFCFYAEDADIFGNKNMFHDYMAQFPAAEFHSKLKELFRVLNTKPEHRKYLRPDLAAFPYVNGGLFSSDITIPLIDDEIRTLILQRASDDFDWSEISPTIFGAVFESTLNPETRRSGGMHYTSIENIHKVIDPLFLDDLKAELAAIKAISALGTKRKKAVAFQKKLAGLKFFDPACGSGNFLTEAYISLRRLENEVIPIINKTEDGQLAHNFVIQVSINQFYGIEINDFACSVAQTALWIAELQMLQETNEIVGSTLDPLPLKTYTNIHEGNALRLDWNNVVPASELNYIMGNPPFVGESERTKEQSDDMAMIFGKGNSETKLDYVLCWYKKAQPFVLSGAKVSFVSTNSICQGESVPTFWKNFLTKDIEIFYAYRSFKWISEASEKAEVWCVIIGLQLKSDQKKLIFDSGKVSNVKHINPYLYPTPDIWIKTRSSFNLCSMPKITKGSEPSDGGFLFLTLEEKESIIKKYPSLEKYIRPFVGAKEFIHGHMGSFTRFCFWFVGASPRDFISISEITNRLKAIKELRLTSSASRIQKKADYPYLFCQIRQPSTNYMIIPRHSSSDRDYIPFGYLDGNVICGDANNMIPKASNYMFGVMASSIHMYWVKIVCGRLGIGYRYTPSVYNNFPWPSPTAAQKDKISTTAQAILDARALYPDNTLAELYDGLGMPPELRRAHKANDAAVLEAYGFAKTLSESEIVTRLFQLYQELTTK